MVRVELVREKIRVLRATLDALRAKLPREQEPLAADRDVRDLVCFRFYLVVQEAVDVASHIVADEGWGPAPSLRDHFAILGQRGVLDAALVAELSAAVKVRNLIAHGYVAVDPVKLHAAATALVPLAERYCAAVLAWAEMPRAGV